jgi:predicted amidophosphoribosyltransferase
MPNRSKGDEGSVWDFLAGLTIGFIGSTILSFFMKSECPICKNKIERGVTICPSCKSELNWK